MGPWAWFFMIVAPLAGVYLLIAGVIVFLLVRVPAAGWVLGIIVLLVAAVPMIFGAEFGLVFISAGDRLAPVLNGMVAAMSWLLMKVGAGLGWIGDKLGVIVGFFWSLFGGVASLLLSVLGWIASAIRAIFLFFGNAVGQVIPG